MDTDVVKAGDPKRAGEILVRIVKRQHLPTHLLLGVFAVDAAQDYSRRQVAEAEAWRQVSSSADFCQPYPRRSCLTTDLHDNRTRGGATLRGYGALP